MVEFRWNNGDVEEEWKNCGGIMEMGRKSGGIPVE